jgi:hypothetical protein
LNLEEGSIFCFKFSKTAIVEEKCRLLFCFKEQKRDDYIRNSTEGKIRFEIFKTFKSIDKVGFTFLKSIWKAIRFYLRKHFSKCKISLFGFLFQK